MGTNLAVLLPAEQVPLVAHAVWIAPRAAARHLALQKVPFVHGAVGEAERPASVLHLPRPGELIAPLETTPPGDAMPAAAPGTHAKEKGRPPQLTPSRHSPLYTKPLYWYS